MLCSSISSSTCRPRRHWVSYRSSIVKALSDYLNRKTQLAIEYSHRIREESSETWVFWVHASNTARFEESYRSIAEKVKINGWDKPEAEILQLVKNWLCDEANGRWVMIVDNADDLNVFFNQSPDYSLARSLSDLLPQSPNGHIVITSRNQEVAFRLVGRKADIIQMKPMNQDHALLLLDKKIPGNLDATDTTELVKTLDYMPLAITQAAAYISQRASRVTVSKYLHDLRKSDKNRASLLQKDVGDPRRDGKASNSIIATWQISFDCIRREQQPSAARLLSLMSLFDRQGIPESLLLQLYQEDNETEAKFEDDIFTLTSYSLVTIIEGIEFEMHRLVQLSTKKWLELYDELEIWKEKYINIMEKAFPVGRHKNWTICGKLFPHAEMVLLYWPTNEVYLTKWASILYNAACYSSEMGSYDTAEEMNRRALEGYETALGKEHPDTLTSVDTLAMVLRDQGKYEQAEQMNRRALEGWEKALGKEHPDMLTSVSNLALVLKDQGKYKQAEQMNRRALEGYEKALGKEHPFTLTSLNNVAGVLQDQGKYKQAEEINRRALEGREKALGKEHPDTLTSLNNVAGVLQDQGKYEQAEQMNRRALEGYERTLGKEHPNTLTSMDNLAVILWFQGKYEHAEEINCRALEGREKTLGKEHPFTLTSVDNLAGILRFQGKYEQAEEMNRRALEGREKTLEKEHPDTLTSLYCLAYLLRQRKQHQEASILYKRGYEGYRKTLGHDHPTTKACFKHYVSLLEHSVDNKVSFLDFNQGSLYNIIFYTPISWRVNGDIRLRSHCICYFNSNKF
jgi:tetratricopeptide (TPR) repeat protein